MMRTILGTFRAVCERRAAARGHTAWLTEQETSRTQRRATR